jgi:hypothetical protein
MARNTAMRKDPPLRGQARKDAQAAAGKTPPPSTSNKQDGGVPTRPENLAIYNTMTPDQQARYRKIRANKGGPEALKYLQQFQGQTAAPTGSTPESVTQEGFMGAGQAYQGLLDEFGRFDPYQMQQMYEPAFQQEMDRARQNVMGQFERRNQRQFEQQRTSLQQQIAERGLDPASPAAQELMRQQNEREDMARQEAMSSAEQAAYGVQQQAFGQAGQTAGMRYDIFGSTFNPAYMAGIGAQYGQQQQQQQQDWQARQAELDRRNQRWMLRNQPRGGGGGGQPPLTPWQRIEAESLGQGQSPQQNPWAAGAQGFAAGVGQGVGRWVAS